ncbi:4256_t:CDS:2 [Dentiscutata erythropus]|uniref:4256_t:CDS:1 n=1 Tax=Dentiscutata erythropus TaxID=1348616 RepID=A0A9N9F8D5_9GLOM|nr:4256_t:CDS:2 [Dentiscutata erythropus]
MSGNKNSIHAIATHEGFSDFFSVERKPKRFKKHPDECNVGALEKRDSLSYREWLEKEFEGGNIKNYDYSKFCDFIELGRGSYSIVYSADYRGKKIACKKSEFKQHNENNHENIVKFLGSTACKIY